MKAARNRQRARQGLPPLEDEPEPKETQNEFYDTTEERQKREMEEKTRKQKEKLERKREKERKKHIRPWDKPKLNKHDDSSSENDDKGWEYKKEREPMSQEQWNEKQREKRPQEFAPVYNAPIVAIPASFPHRNRNIQEIFEDDSAPLTPSLFFTSKKPPPIPTIQKPLDPTPVPIQNEIFDDDEEDDYVTQKRPYNDDGDDDDDVLDENDDRVPNKSGAEIAPPLTFDYYGPTSSKQPRRSGKNPREHLETSIEAGLKFLREQSDKNASSGGKRVWTSKADY